MLKHGILGLLNYSDMTGYDIKEVFSRSLNYFWTAQTSQIYRELNNLEKNHWAESVLIEQNGKPDKKLFHITKEGKEELMRWLVCEDTGLTMRTPILKKAWLFLKVLEDKCKNIWKLCSWRMDILNCLRPRCLKRIKLCIGK